jgi:hypothetical protein
MMFPSKSTLAAALLALLTLAAAPSATYAQVGPDSYGEGAGVLGARTLPNTGGGLADEAPVQAGAAGLAGLAVLVLAAGARGVAARRPVIADRRERR